MITAVCEHCGQGLYQNQNTLIWYHTKTSKRECMLEAKPIKTEMASLDKAKEDNREPKQLKNDGELWGADPACDHHVICAPGGGVKCTKCGGWFCY